MTAPPRAAFDSFERRQGRLFLEEEKKAMAPHKISLLGYVRRKQHIADQYLAETIKRELVYTSAVYKVGISADELDIPSKSV